MARKYEGNKWKNPQWASAGARGIGEIFPLVFSLGYNRPILTAIILFSKRYGPAQLSW